MSASVSNPARARPPLGQPRRRLLPAMILAALSAPLQADPAQIEILAFDANGPVAGIEVQTDGGSRQQQDAYGGLQIQLPAGDHRITVYRGEDVIAELPLTTIDDEYAEIILSIETDGTTRIALESSAGGRSNQNSAEITAGPPGTLEGQIVSADDGAPISGARVFVSGTPLDVTTDSEGRYRIELSAGEYSLSVLAPSFSAQTIGGVAIVSEQRTARQIELTPAGLELPEFIVLEPFIEGSLAAFVEEKRTSSAVADILGAEQISRSGDSDAAGALKRVTGLTLVDGKFIYVRGLGERYSSTLLNGAQVPSPDPTRRVVPLDLFPTEILSGIVVQKTYAADMPGEFGGGTVQLRTRGVPESFLLKFSATVGYVDGTTNQTGLSYAGGSRDWLGYDDGARAAPQGLLVTRLPVGAQLESLGEAVAAKGYQTSPKQVGPNTGFSFSIGDDYQFSEGAWSLGFIAGTRYSQSWDIREEERAFFALSGGQLFAQQRSTRERTERAIDTSLFASGGLKIGEHHIVNATAIQVRQTTDEVQTDTGILGSGEFERLRSLEWIENELQVAQVNGVHSLPGLGNLVVDWQYTKSRASRAAPNTRDQRFTFNEETEQFTVDVFGFSQRFDELQDDATEFKLDLKLPWKFREGLGLTAFVGAVDLSKDRVSETFRFRYNTSGPRFNTDDPEVFFNDDTIGQGRRDYFLRSASQVSDNYTASVDLSAYYLAVDAYWGPVRVYLGARQEDFTQEVVTLSPFVVNPVPVVGGVAEKDLLPAATLTWAYSDNAQLRFAYSNSVSRPDVREQSTADFIDPLLDIRVTGNPDLKQTEITNLDLRWEYYFSATESLSFALFQKDFINPIELVESPASGTVLNIINAATATNRGAEIDYYRSLAGINQFSWSPDWLKAVPWADLYLGFNYAYIDSTIDLGDSAGFVTNAVRPLQGQSPYVGNVSLAFLPEDGDVEATLLFNVFGERISQVGTSMRPDTYEQPFEQLDFTLSAKLPWDGWKAKLRLKNLLDPEVQFTVGDQVARSYSKGREIALSIEWKM